MTDVDRARQLARGALLALERNRRRLDDLNVYPVPDGDTGTNLTLTVRAAVTQPVEGTMLTVIREMAEEAEAHTDGSVRELIAAVVLRGADAVERTPELLDVLRSAGVVDAGGAGLLEIARGIAAVVAGEPIPDAPAEEELTFDAVP